jgi:hypothetical protein
VSAAWPFPQPAVAWAVTFVADESDPERLLSRMTIIKDRARAVLYAGDPLKPHTEPRRIRPLVFGDDDG